MTASERIAAKAYMEQGNSIADFVIGAIAGAASIIHGIERGLRALAR